MLHLHIERRDSDCTIVFFYICVEVVVAVVVC
jgi:hypothetical protein